MVEIWHKAFETLPPSPTTNERILKLKNAVPADAVPDPLMSRVSTPSILEDEVKRP